VIRLRQRSIIAIAMLCIVAQLFTVAHLVLVRHARCAEHGEVTHAGESHPDVALPVGPETVLAASDTGAAPDDDHCGWLSERGEVRDASIPVFSTIPVARVAPPVACHLVRAVTRPLYRLAPKLSPPGFVV
jgi:hypothetical protein